MTRTTAPKTGRTTYHRDGTVTIWDVYQQSWVRGFQLRDELLASLNDGERDRVLRHTEFTCLA